jgi:hypothetical protein
MTYTPPSPEELRALLSEWGVSQVQAAKLVDVNDRTMRRYCLVGGCPYPVLATLAGLCTGVTPGVDWRYSFSSVGLILLPSPPNVSR